MILKIIYYKIKISCKKLRIIINKIKKFSVLNMLIYLTFLNNKSSRILKKLILSFSRSIKQNYNKDLDNIKIIRFTAEKGVRLKRINFLSRGRYSILNKCYSNIILEFLLN